MYARRHAAVATIRHAICRFFMPLIAAAAVDLSAPLPRVICRVV